MSIRRELLTVFTLVMLPLLAIGQKPDQGMTNSTHEKYVGKIVWSNDRVDFENPNESTFKNKFQLTESLYGRAYFYRSVENEKRFKISEKGKRSKKGEPYSASYGYGAPVVQFVYIDGQKVGTLCDEIYYENRDATTWQVPLNHKAEEQRSSETWMSFVNNLSAGEHTVRVEFLSAECTDEAGYNLGRAYEISDPMAVGEFTLVVAEGEKIELTKTFEDGFAEGFEDQEVVDQALASIKKYANDSGWEETFTKAKIQSEGYELVREEYTGRVLRRAVNIWFCATWPDGSCTVQSFGFSQEFDGLNYGIPLYNGDMGHRRNVKCTD